MDNSVIINTYIKKHLLISYLMGAGTVLDAGNGAMIK